VLIGSEVDVGDRHTKKVISFAYFSCRKESRLKSNELKQYWTEYK
jgi:hypothetical protein